MLGSRRWPRTSPGNKAYALLSEIWSHVGQPNGQLSSNDYEKLKPYFVEHLLNRFGKGSSRKVCCCLSKEEAADIVNTHLPEFLAQLHVRHITGNILSPEDLFEEFDDHAFARIKGKEYSPPRETNSRDDDVLSHIFGEHATIELCRDTVKRLFQDEEWDSYNIVTEYLDQYVRFGATSPTALSVAEALRHARISEADVNSAMLRFANCLGSQKERQRNA